MEARKECGPTEYLVVCVGKSVCLRTKESLLGNCHRLPYDVVMVGFGFR